MFIPNKTLGFCEPYISVIKAENIESFSPLPVLAVSGDQSIANLSLRGSLTPLGENWLHQPSGLTLGYLEGEVEGDLASLTNDIYEKLFTRVGNQHLIRIWNIVPGINATTNQEPNYWSFNRGRKQAFTNHFSATRTRPWPAASAVGSTLPSKLKVYFLCAPEQPEHFENPRQVPAFEYPPQYGSEPPAFSRATRLPMGPIQQPLIFVSGTAAVIGHRSEGQGDLDKQLEITWENLGILSQEMDIIDIFNPTPHYQRLFIIYLRHPEHLAQAKAFVTSRTNPDNDLLIFLNAEICRVELDVEIELTMLPQTIQT